MSALPQYVNTSCASCWMDLEDELALARHVEIEHPSLYALPPYRKTEEIAGGEVATLPTKKKSV